ncbi:DUF1269 domain-containing protein [Paraburkholderia pallida]|uniref:DUF1269 domain-containing protein n=1 Tax=Paraburkholderia pallida TaxID=2547399 RepID=A0A4V1B005_9BURK|nr:DUF1269 domain-containing protein [Paraburkholderia pallida]QBR01093.1 DUF1269 domain-containing protein [Paraburkholderia pallida]
MTQKLVVATFDNLDVAQRAARDFKNFEKDGDGFKIESGAMVQKSADGKLTVLSQYTESYWGTVIGAVTGGLIGLIGGPLGALAGVTIGAGAGIAEHVFDSKLTKSISEELKPGSVALIIEAKEPPEYEIENVVLGYGGKVFTQPLSW